MISVLLLLVGVFACAVSVFFIRYSQVPAAYLAAYRLLFAAVLLTPVFIYSLRKSGQKYSWTNFIAAITAALVLALHFISWAMGARMTNLANATLLVNLAPIAMPFVMFFLAREMITRTEIVGTLLAVAGMIVLTWHDYRFASDSLRGDIVCLIAMLLVTIYLALAKRNRGSLGIWVYVVPIYAIAGLFCLIIARFIAGPFVFYPAREWGWLLALAIVPTIIGHSLLNWSMAKLRGQTVTITNMVQFVFVAIVDYLVSGNLPKAEFYVAAALVMIGSILAVRSASQLASRQPEELQQVAAGQHPPKPSVYADVPPE